MIALYTTIGEIHIWGGHSIQVYH